MHVPLSDSELLSLWESAATQEPVARSLTLLGGAARHHGGELWELTVAQRDAELLALREASFGTALHGRAECSRCEVVLELTLDTRALGTALPSGSPELEFEGRTLRLRLPTGRDLQALQRADPPDPEAWLIERCVVSAEPEFAAPVELSSELRAAISECLGAHAPFSDVSVSMHCPACGHAETAYLDVGEFLWAEISAAARHLLVEVAELARAYGWREADILAMSAQRRHAYRELAG